jgi:dolichol kinase
VTVLARREPWRRVLHLASGSLGLAAPRAPARVATFFFLALAGIALALEVARWRAGAARSLVERVGGGLFRPAEASRVSGATTLAIGYALAWWLFPPAVAASAIVVAAVADPAGAVVGMRFHPNAGRKTMIGSAAVLLVSALVLLAMGTAPVPAIAAAAAAALAERAPWPAADNVSVPLLTAAVLAVAS